MIKNNARLKTIALAVASVGLIASSLGMESRPSAIKVAPTHTSSLSPKQLASVTGGIGCGKCRLGCNDTKTCDAVTSHGVKTGTKGTVYCPHNECGPGTDGCSSKGDVICNYMYTGDNDCNVLTPSTTPTCPPTANATCTSSC